MARLRRAEEALSKAGLKIEDDDGDVDLGHGSEDITTTTLEIGKEKIVVDSHRTIEDGKLIVDRGQSRYMEA